MTNLERFKKLYLRFIQYRKKIGTEHPDTIKLADELDRVWNTLSQEEMDEASAWCADNITHREPILENTRSYMPDSFPRFWLHAPRLVLMLIATAISVFIFNLHFDYRLDASSVELIKVIFFYLVICSGLVLAYAHFFKPSTTKRERELDSIKNSSYGEIIVFNILYNMLERSLFNGALLSATNVWIAATIEVFSVRLTEHEFNYPSLLVRYPVALFLGSVTLQYGLAASIAVSIVIGLFADLALYMAHKSGLAPLDDDMGF